MGWSAPRHARWGWLFGILWLTGCGDGVERPLAQWTLRTPDGGAQQITLPTRLEDRLPQGPCSYTLTRDVELPTAWQGRPLTLAIPYFTGMTELRVDGHLVPWSGSEPVRVYRSRGTQLWRLPAQWTVRDTLELELRVDHTWQRSAWLDSVPRLTPDPRGGAYTTWSEVSSVYWTSLCLGGLLAIGFSSLLLFLLDRRKTSYLWMGIAALVVSYYLLFMLGFTQFAGPTGDVPLLATAALAAITAIVYKSHAEAGIGTPSWAWSVGLMAIAIASIATPAPFEYIIWLAGAAVTLILTAVGHVIVLYVRQLRANPGNRGYLVNSLAMGCFCVSMVPDALIWTGITDPFPGIRPVSLGILVYCLAQFGVLIRDHLLTLKRSERNEQEVRSLNEELRRQVAERSQRLSEALARLGVAEEGVTELVEGQVVDDRYRVVRRLGEGAMGVAYEVSRVNDGTALAIKVLNTTEDARLMARFAREAHIAANLSHPNLVRILDVGFASSGFMYLVMELVEGCSIDRESGRWGDLDWALPVLRDVASGLEVIHAGGIVHRDLKPSNVLFSDSTEGPRAKIADFGISGIASDRRLVEEVEDVAGSEVTPERSLATERLKFLSIRRRQPTVPTGLLGEEATATWMLGPPKLTPPQGDGGSSGSGRSGGSLTHHGEIIGTPAYMAPELVHGAPASFSSDVFAFGAMAYQLLTGQLPYDPPPCLARLRGEELPAVARLARARPELPYAVIDVVDGALSYDPAARPDASALRLAFGDSTEPRAGLAGG